METAQAAIETLSWKVGLVLVVLGGMHFLNLYVFAKLRGRNAHRPDEAAALPPRLPVTRIN